MTDDGLMLNFFFGGGRAKGGGQKFYWGVPLAPPWNRPWPGAQCSRPVPSFVCSSITKLWTLYFETNEPISMQIGINLSTVQCHERSTSGQEV